MPQEVDDSTLVVPQLKSPRDDPHLLTWKTGQRRCWTGFENKRRRVRKERAEYSALSAIFAIKTSLLPKPLEAYEKFIRGCRILLKPQHLFLITRLRGVHQGP
jgi:hypothetical protein